jgi:hypothetical protein
VRIIDLKIRKCSVIGYGNVHELALERVQLRREILEIKVHSIRVENKFYVLKSFLQREQNELRRRITLNGQAHSEKEEIEFDLAHAELNLGISYTHVW